MKNELNGGTRAEWALALRRLARLIDRFRHLYIMALLPLGVLFLAILAPAQAAEVSEDNLLLLDWVVEEQLLASSVTAYSMGDQVVVPLAEAAAALEFPIAVDAAAGTANGWFIRPERSFALDVGRGAVEVAGRRESFPEGTVLVHGNDILVDIDALSRWLPVDLRLHRSSLSVEVLPRETLPMQERQARRQDGRLAANIGPATLPVLETPYHGLGMPAADVGLGYSVRRDQEGGKAMTGLSYSALISGDLAWMDSRLYLGGSRDDTLSNARFSMSRSNLGLPLGLRYVEIGDIVPALVPGLNNSRNVERGLLIQGGGSVTGRDDLIGTDFMNISGDALQGWDVELFQNGMRVGFQTVGADGRYNFRNIEPLGGENEFELVFYGPAGERRTEKLTRYGGLMPDQPGSVRYQLSVSQKSRQLYEGEEVFRLQQSDPGSTRVGAGMEVRVLPKLALRGSWTSQVIDGERHDYNSVGLRASLGGMSLGADATRNPWGQTRWDASLQAPAEMRLFGFDARFTHTHYALSELSEAEFADEDGDGLADDAVRQRSRTGLIVSRSFGATSTRVAAFHNRGLERDSSEFTAGLTHRLGNASFGSTLSYYRYGDDDNGVSEDDRFNGSVFFSTRAYPLSVRGGMHYTVAPETRVNQYFIDSSLAVAKDMTMAFTLTHTPSTALRASLTRYAAGFNWQLPELTLSPRLVYDSDGTYSGFIYASFSLAPHPDATGLMVSGRSFATGGAVAVRTFLDHDASGSFSAGDEPLPGVLVRAPQGHRTATTGSDGVAVLNSLPTHRATDVVVDEASLPEVDLVSTHAGNSVRPRPTVVAMIDFPVRPTGSIEGHIHEMRYGQRQPLRGALVELHDANGELKSFKISGQDGYYVFEQIPYGDYTVTLGAAQRARMEGEPRAVQVGAAVADVDILVGAVTDAGEPAMPASMPVALPPAVAAAPERPPLAPISTAAAPAPLTQATRSAARVAMLEAGRDGKVAQLGAFADPQRAQHHIDALVSAGQIDPARVGIVVGDRGARGRFYRVLLSPGSGTAARLCAVLKADGIACIAATP